MYAAVAAVTEAVLTLYGFKFVCVSLCVCVCVCLHHRINPMFLNVVSLASLIPRISILKAVSLTLTTSYVQASLYKTHLTL